MKLGGSWFLNPCSLFTMYVSLGKLLYVSEFSFLSPSNGSHKCLPVMMRGHWDDEVGQGPGCGRWSWRPFTVCLLSLPISLSTPEAPATLGCFPHVAHGSGPPHAALLHERCHLYLLFLPSLPLGFDPFLFLWGFWVVERILHRLVLQWWSEQCLGGHRIGGKWTLSMQMQIPAGKPSI